MGNRRLTGSDSGWASTPIGLNVRRGELVRCSMYRSVSMLAFRTIPRFADSGIIGRRMSGEL
jgi:hypothetical protein